MDLLRIVKQRNARKKKENHEEKMDHLLSPYMVAQELPKIEDYLFNHFSNSLNKCGSALRDRYFLLISLYAVANLVWHNPRRISD